MSTDAELNHASGPEALADAQAQVTLVVVTFNSAHCLPALAEHLADWPEVVVVDNGSEDGSVDAVAALWPQARVVALAENLGFGAANNRGVACVRTPYALLLNPDCIITPAAITGLWQAAQVDARVGLVGPQLMRDAQHPEVNYRMGLLDWPGRGPAASGPVCVGFVCGAVMLLRVSAFLSIQGFDERFFLYYEDDDLCWRLRQSGQSLLVLPEVRVMHRSRGSVRTRRATRGEYLRGYHHAQSKLTFTRLHRSGALAQRQRLRLLWATALVLPLRALLWSPKHLARTWGRWLGAWRWRA
jgi:GT2 family glycosyltransferase